MFEISIFKIIENLVIQCVVCGPATSASPQASPLRWNQNCVLIKSPGDSYSPECTHILLQSESTINILKISSPVLFTIDVITQTYWLKKQLSQFWMWRTLTTKCGTWPRSGGKVQECYTGYYCWIDTTGIWIAC